jgi:hypothetical protein
MLKTGRHQMFDVRTCMHAAWHYRCHASALIWFSIAHDARIPLENMLLTMHSAADLTSD